MKICMLGQAHTRPAQGWNTPVNDTREWLRVLGGGDVLNYQQVLAKPAMLNGYDLVIVELTPKTHRLPRFIKKHHPDLFCVGLVEGRVEYVVRSSDDMEGLFEFCTVVDDLDLLGVLVERTVPYYRLYVSRPERVAWLGVPYPKDWTDRLAFPTPQQRKPVIELGSAMDSRNGITNLLILRELQKRFPRVNGRVFAFHPREPEMIKALGIKAEILRPRSWPDYFRVHASAFAVLCMDDRRTWGRYVLDSASARLPYVGTNLSHCGEQDAVLQCDPFDTELALDYLSELLERYFKEDHSRYEEVCAQQYLALNKYTPAASRERFLNAVLAAAYTGPQPEPT